MLNESRESDVKDFVVNRNPEFALEVIPYADNDKRWNNVQDQVAHYLELVMRIVKNNGQLKFENLHRCFP